ncbi:uncharacterized protein LOC141546259 [Sminthopsis crassicaudata]|uniref:uncharacterized protein LOC141546259 n=1 Tax=Sminthopsis crassicaudata TaxID=9301 RepID=UPI003D68E0D2
MQIPPRIHPPSISEFTQIPGLSHLPSSTDGKEEVMSFPDPFSNTEIMQIPDFSDTRLPQEPIQTPSVTRAKSMRKSSQAATDTKFTEVPTFPDLPLKESIQVPDFSARSSGRPEDQDAMHVSSRIHTLSVSKSIQIPGLSHLSLSTVDKQDVMSFPGPFSNRESIHIPDFSDIGPQKVIQAPSAYHAMSVSKSTQVSVFSKPSISTTVTEEISLFPILVSSKESIQVPDSSATSPSQDAMQISSRIHTILVSKSTQIPSLSHTSSLTVDKKEIMSFPDPFSDRESKQVPDISDIRLPQEPLQTPSANYVTSVSKSSQAPMVSEPRTRITFTEEISLFPVLVSPKESKQVPDGTVTSSGQDAMQVSSRIHISSASKSTQIPGLSHLSSLTVDKKEVMSFPGPFSNRESLQAPDTSDTRLPQEADDSVTSMNTSSQVIVSDQNTPTIFIEQILSFPGLVSSKESKQIPDFSATSSDQYAMQVPSKIHSLSVSKSTQIPGFTHVSSLTMSKDDVMTFQSLFSNTESRQVPDFSNKGLSQEPMKTPSSNHVISVNKSTQVFISSEPHTSTSFTEEISSFPSLTSLKESKPVPDVTATSSGQDAMQVPSRIHPLSMNKFTQVPGFSHLTSSTVETEEMPFPSSFSYRKYIHLSDFSDRRSSQQATEVPSTAHAISMSQYTQVPSFSDPSSSTVCVKDISSFLVPISSRASIQIPDISLPREAVQIPSTYPATAICKSTQIPSSSSQSSSIVGIEDASSVSPRESQAPDFADKSSPTEDKQVSYTSDTVSRRKSTQVPSSRGIGDLPSFIVSVSSKESTQVPDSSDLISTQPKQVPLTSNATSSKSPQVFSSLVLYTSNKSIQFPSYSGLISLSQAVQVPSISSTSSASESMAVPSVTEPYLAELSKEFSTLPRGASLSKHGQIPSFSGTIASREYTGVSSLSGKHSIQESLEIHSVSSSTSKEFKDISSLLTLRLERESFQDHSISYSRSVERDAVIYSQSSSREAREVSFPAPTTSSKSLQFPSFSGINFQTLSKTLSGQNLENKSIQFPPSKESVEYPPLFMTSAEAESIQDASFSIPNSVRESFEFPIFSGPSSTKESLAHLSSELSSTDSIVKEKTHLATSSSPGKSISDFHSSIPMVLSKSVQFPSFTVTSLTKESMEVPTLPMPKSMQEYKQDSALSGPDSFKEFSEFPMFSGPISTKESFEVTPSSSLSSTKEFSDDSTGSAKPISPKEILQSSPRKSKNISFSPQMMLVSKTIQFPSFTGHALKEYMEIAALSVSSSKSDSIPGPILTVPNPLRETFEFPIFSGPSSRESLEEPSLYPSRSSKECTEILPSANKRLQRESTERECTSSCTTSSPRKSKKASPSCSQREVNISIQFPFFSCPNVLSVSSPKREPIQDLNTTGKKLQECIEIHAYSGTSSRDKEILPLFPAISLRESREILPFLGFRSICSPENENIDFPSSSKKQLKQVSPPPSLTSLSEDIQFPSFLSQKKLSAESSHREFIQAPDFIETKSREHLDFSIVSEPNSTKEYIEEPFSLVSSNEATKVNE